MVKLNDSVMIAATLEYVVAIALVLIIGYLSFVICHLCVCAFMYLIFYHNFYVETHKAFKFLFNCSKL